MGFIIDIDERVTIELRRMSVILHIEGRDPRDVAPEFDYADVPAIVEAMARVLRERRYADWRERHPKGDHRG